jgi:hypothetical protein
MKARNDRRRWAVRALVASSVIGVVGVGVALAEDMWVNRPFVEIRAGKGSIFDVVAKADQGAKLTVIDHEGTWLKVQYNGQEGYVLASALSARQVGGDAFSGMSDSQSSGMSSGNAAKGFTPGEFAAKKGYSEEPLKQLEADVKKDTSPQGYMKFTADGKIGPDKPA